MDRNRIVVALAMAFSFMSILLGIISIFVNRSSSIFSADSGSLFTPGNAGVALIHIRGEISDGYDYFDSTGADRIMQMLHEAEEDSQILGVILEINSPGGEPGATRRIYDEVMHLRRKKPVVAVVTEMAASGGYYVASAADRIYAYPSTLIGSIGVISLHPDLSGLLNKYGIKVETLKAGRYKDSSYPFRRMSDEERRMYNDLLGDAYQQFISDVAEGRKQSQSTVRQWAEGKIFSGKRAKADQMIDDLGGRREAIEGMKILLKTDRSLQIYEAKPDFFDSLKQLDGSGFPGFSLFQMFAGRSHHSQRFRSGIYYLHPGSLDLFALPRLSGEVP